jgi:GT2 family glycosyltransferase
MQPPALSIIIPTYRRGTILRECLARIGLQTALSQLEVIVVSDGEMDKETALLAKETFQFPATFLTIGKSQQGTARNRGVKQSKGAVTLFLGDDMYLLEDACASHLQAHSQPHGGEKKAVLGFVTWDPDMEITPVMRWLEESGWQFGYPKIERFAHGFIPQEIQHRFSYTGNISVPTEIARRFPFAEGLSLYGWEDIEWGLRLREAGVKLFYEPDAKALHHHPMTLEASLQRMETLGRSAVMFEKQKPELTIVPKGWKRLAYRMAALLPTMNGRHRKAFLQGLRA